MELRRLRQDYHERLCGSIIRISSDKKKGVEYPNFADVGNKSSIQIAWGVIRRINLMPDHGIISGQAVGDRFEYITKEFIEQSFGLLSHIRPGNWAYSIRTPISAYDQYQHLAHLERVILEDRILASTLGGDYIVRPDIVVGRNPISDGKINEFHEIISQECHLATLTPVREENHKAIHLILHASISCKWTIRSDRSQNTRTEALNLIRNRKGPLPHIVCVTAEPLPTRIASLAIGTGDMDCVYHFALPELKETIEELGNQDQLEMLLMLVEGRRLRDISDLPFDLAA